MDFYNHNYRNGNALNYCFIDSKVGDVNGDGRLERVYLIGTRPFQDNPNYFDNITLIISTSKNKKLGIPLDQAAGYNPTLFLGRFTKNNVNDIFVEMNTGGSGGMTISFLYSYYKSNLKLLYSSNEFNELYDYLVEYLDYYRLQVSNLNLQQGYTIDISSRPKDYLNQIYRPDGKLKEKTLGFTAPLGAVAPMDINNDGIYELFLTQQVSGLYMADSFGYVQTILDFGDGKQELFSQVFSVYPFAIK